MKKFILYLPLIICIYGCDNSTETDLNSDSLKLILGANKTTGFAPLTIEFTGKIVGNTEGLEGHVPDYLFYSGLDGTLIRYILPDTTKTLNTNWNVQRTYPAGEFTAYLIYQGILKGEDHALFSDTLRIIVN